MRTSFSFVICMLFFANGYCFADKIILPWAAHINCTTDKPALSYQPGEKMIFTFTADTAGYPANMLKLHWICRKDGGDKIEGEAPADNPLTVETELSSPGFANVLVELRDADGGEVMRSQSADKSNPQAIHYSAGAAVYPEQLEDCGEPEDFDTFWTRQKELLATVPFSKTDCTEIERKDGVILYRLSIPCAGPRPVTGFMRIPEQAAPKSLPLRIGFIAYGVREQKPFTWGDKKSIRIEINAHGQPLDAIPEVRAEFMKNLEGYALKDSENQNPETAFFYGMAMRVLRILEYGKTLPQWNGRDLIVQGGSQAGMQSIWAAALDSDVTEAYPFIIWCCDLKGNRQKNRYDGWRPNWHPALDYYDPVFMAKRIRTAKVDITCAGLGDNICPPSGLAVCYRNLATPYKSIRWVQGGEHGYYSPSEKDIVWKSY